MILSLFAIFAIAVTAPWLARALRGASGWMLAIVPGAAFAYFASQIPIIAAGESLSVAIPWSVELGIDFALRLDGLALVFALLVTGIGALIVVYAGTYLLGDPLVGRFYLFFFAFMGAMLGLVIADDLITLYVFWELTTITSFLLIGYNHREEAARNAALQALLVTTLGGFAMLAGFVLLGAAGGSMRISELLANGDAIRAHALYMPALALILAGAFTKSAIFPFHFWLPNAMEAPTPVSAYLHSSTMVQAGVFLLARLHPAIGGTDVWMWSLAILGGFTLLLGAALAMKTSDLKRVLAFATVAALGLLTMLIGFGTEAAILAMAAYLVAHALYKGALFLVAGIIYYETGIKDAEAARGLFRMMPLTAVFAALAGASMAGLPPLLGFFGKELVLESISDMPGIALLFLVVSILALGLVAAAALLVAFLPFWGRVTTTQAATHSDDSHDQIDSPSRDHSTVPLSLWIGPGLLAALGVVLGLFPHWTGHYLVGPTVHAVLGRSPAHEVELFHGLGVAFLYSAVALAVGIAIYMARRPVRDAWAALSRFSLLDPERWYSDALKGTFAVAGAQTRLLQHGYLRYYVLVAVVATLVIVGAATFASRERIVTIPWHTAISDLYLHEFTVALIAAAAAIMVVRSRALLSAVAALGAVGFATTLIFVLYSAPDLAMTQFVFETMIVILLVLVLYRLPKLELYTSTPTRVRDALIAGSFGAMMTVLVLLAMVVPEHDLVSDEYVARAVPEAHGRNIVNVILVDFRAFDTLGELVVLALAGIGVYTLVRLRPHREKHARHRDDARIQRSDPLPLPRLSTAISIEAAGSPDVVAPRRPDRRLERPTRRSVLDFRASHVFQASVQLFLPLLLVFSLVVLVRGHNEPGGGFIGGLIASAAFAMHAIAFSPKETHRLLRVDQHTLIWIGLALALSSGLFGMILGEPFMTGQWVTVYGPLQIALTLGTPLLFDVGVFLLVIGSSLLIIFTAAEE